MEAEVQAKTNNGSLKKKIDKCLKEVSSKNKEKVK